MNFSLTALNLYVKINGVTNKYASLMKGIKIMRAYERLLKYVKFDTQSSDTSGLHPSRSTT